MRDEITSDVGPWLVTAGARTYAELPGHLGDLLDRLSEGSRGEGGVLVARASELLGLGDRPLTGWVDTKTFYFVFADVALPALMRLPTLLGLHKPDRRLHLTRDPTTLRRLLVAQTRVVSMEGIVDAYAVADELVLVLGDLTVRSFPRDRIPRLDRLGDEELAAFELDDDGSYLRWPDLDLDLGVSSLLQAADPAYLAEVEIERLAREDVGTLLREMRESRGLRQRDVPGLSERQVRRLEKGTSHLTADAARQFAEAFDLSTDRFLRRLGRLLRKLAEAGDDVAFARDLEEARAELEGAADVRDPWAS